MNEKEEREALRIIKEKGLHYLEAALLGTSYEDYEHEMSVKIGIRHLIDGKAKTKEEFELLKKVFGGIGEEKHRLEKIYVVQNVMAGEYVRFTEDGHEYTKEVSKATQETGPKGVALLYALMDKNKLSRDYHRVVIIHAIEWAE